MLITGVRPTAVVRSNKTKKSRQLLAALFIMVKSFFCLDQGASASHSAEPVPASGIILIPLKVKVTPSQEP